ncbi:Protein borderless [Eumeta japonica]|uniref:Protein borderless n=1 Tax=Eumeta variegata TaxID=151549 RepID=A0A4C1VQQ1_EUMVA|nr:Protein borderless [Eumeta japonica]
MKTDGQCAGSDFIMWKYLVVGLSLVTLGSEGSILPFENNHLNATVGGYAVMNCYLDFPFGHEIPYQLEWEKDVGSVHLILSNSILSLGPFIKCVTLNFAILDLPSSLLHRYE